MEKLQEHLLFLSAYWLIFWWKFLENPYLLSTSEIASTYFPFWLWMGKKWQAKDDIYYKYPACIPFLSMWYWPSVLVSKLSKHLSLDIAFKLYSYFILSHYLLASFIAYKVMGLFGAITLTYAGYCIKPQTPSFVYTMTWIPGMMVGGWFGAFSCFMAVTGGYWPILVYVMPVMAIINPLCLLGLIPALIQIIPFLWYWPKSVRAKEKIDRKFGRLPWWKLKDLVWPTNSVNTTNGVHYPEVAMYMGIAPFLIWHQSVWVLSLVVSLGIVCGALLNIQRIPCRALYLLTFSLTLLSVECDKATLQVLLFPQLFLLLQNNSIYPSFPFSQWWNKPSLLYSKYSDKDKWPHFTGYLDGRKTNGYQGAFRLSESYSAN